MWRILLTRYVFWSGKNSGRFLRSPEYNVARIRVPQLGVTIKRQNFLVAPLGRVNFTVPKVAGDSGGVTTMLASGGAISVGQFTRSSESWNL